MARLNINDIPTTQSEMMKKDHQEFTDILNNIITLTTADQDSSSENAIDTELNKWLKHTEEHFAKEEELMLKANPPPYQVHKGEHDQVLKTLKDSISHWQLNRDKKSLPPIIQELLPEWFIQL